MINFLIVVCVKPFQIVVVEVENDDLVVGVRPSFLHRPNGLPDVVHCGLAQADAVGWQLRIVVVAMEDAHKLPSAEENAPCEHRIGGG